MMRIGRVSFAVCESIVREAVWLQRRWDYRKKQLRSDAVRLHEAGRY